MICRNSSTIFHSTILSVSVTATIVLIVLPYLGFTESVLVGEPNLSVKNPFGGGPPEIIMNLDDKAYPGELRNFVWNGGDVNDNFPVNEPPRNNITAIIPNNTATIEKGSQVRFAVKDNPSPEVQPDSLSVTAYTLEGYPSKVLNVSSNKADTFNVELDEGKYILLAVATWLPNEENYLTTEGYVSYAYRIDVVG